MQSVSKFLTIRFSVFSMNSSSKHVFSAQSSKCISFKLMGSSISLFFHRALTKYFESLVLCNSKTMAEAKFGCVNFILSFKSFNKAATKLSCFQNCYHLIFFYHFKIKIKTLFVNKKFMNLNLPRNIGKLFVCLFDSLTKSYCFSFH